ncbi:hypothetical protein BURMUCF2_A0949 [Burkholderia multivorans CF2]|nr:hypothetical protein BURMUCF2_A0949 [Burkholderia multivorans CF2]
MRFRYMRIYDNVRCRFATCTHVARTAPGRAGTLLHRSGRAARTGTVYVDRKR